MTEIPSKERYQSLWGELDFSERRRIMRAVNKGEALDDRRDAALAVVTAERQERLWSWIWLIGPLSALLFLGEGLTAFLVNAVLVTAVTGGLSWWRVRRVRRAAARNRAVVEPTPDEGAAGRRARRDHIPRRGTGRQLPPHAKGVRPGAGRPKRSRRERRGG